MMRKLSALLIFLILSFPPLAQAQNWLVDKKNSSVSFELGVQGGLIKGSFAEFDSVIVLDPLDLSRAAVKASIKSDSLAVDDNQVLGIALGATWLFSEKFPLVEFNASKISKTDTQTYLMEGKMKVKDVELDFQFPFTLIISGDRAEARADFNLNREKFKLGSVADAQPDIRVKLHLVASRQ